MAGRSLRRTIANEGGLDISAQGIDSAQTMLAFLGRLGASTQGIELLADTYPGTDTTTGDVVRYLAGLDKEGRPAKSAPKVIRDIQPTEQEIEAAEVLLVQSVVKRLNMLSKRGQFKTSWSEERRAKFIKNGQQEADAAAAMGLRAAAKYLQKKMSDRVESNAFEPPTSEEYAEWRKNKYGVDENVSLRASGLLLKTLQGGRLKLHRRKAGLLG